MKKSFKKVTALACAAAMCAAFAVPAMAEETYDIAVLIKGTDSDYWQTVIAGAETAGKDKGVTVTSYGPTSESDLDEQVTILENIISKGPDAIVIASTSKEATVPAIESAYEQGIKIVLVDGAVESESYDTLLATDNVAGGEMAAQAMVDALTAQGSELSGKVAILSAMAGTASLIDRNDGFVSKLEELAPDLEIVDTRYSNGDVLTAVSEAEDLITANPDLIGFFADNNQCGDAVAQIITEKGKEDEIVAVAFDSDEAEIEALKTGAIDAIILQDPYGMGYYGVENAISALEGESLEKFIDTGVQVATVENMEDEDIQSLLYPPID